MSLEAAIRAELLDHQEIRDIVGERILLGGVPEEFALPAITAQMISERSLQTLHGLTDVREAGYRLDLWAEDYATVRRLLDLCRRALVGRVIARHGVRVGHIVEDLGTILERREPEEIWHGVLELTTPYRLTEV